MRSLWLAGCALLLLHPGAFAQQRITPQQVIQQIGQAYAKVQTLRATVQIREQAVFTSAIHFQRPRQFRIQMSQDGKPVYLVTYDGKTITRYNIAEKTYFQQELGQNAPLPFDVLILAGFSAMAMDADFSKAMQEAYLRAFNKAVVRGKQKVGNVVCRVVEVSGVGGTMLLYIGEKDGLVYRRVYRSTNGESSEERVLALTVNTPIQKALFAFTPPAGARQLQAERPEEEDTNALRGQPAPDFTLTDLDGNTVSLSSLQGKVVFLDFWATWCPPCRQSLPHTQALSQHEKAQSGDLVVLAVNLRETPEQVKQFMQEQGFSFRVVMDRDASVARAYRVQGIPTFVVIDRSGKLAWVQVGFAPGTEKEMEQAILKALGQ